MEQTNDVGIHEDDNIMKFQASIPSIVNTLKKIYISQKVYHWFRSYFFDENTMNYVKSNSTYLFKNVYISLNIRISFLNGPILWT